MQTSSTIHAHQDSRFQQLSHKVFAGELRALICVKDFRTRTRKTLSYSLDTEFVIKRIDSRQDRM